MAYSNERAPRRRGALSKYALPGRNCNLEIPQNADVPQAYFSASLAPLAPARAP
jgi:hypothetical protein